MNKDFAICLEQVNDKKELPYRIYKKELTCNGFLHNKGYNQNRHRNRLEPHHSFYSSYSLLKCFFFKLHCNKKKSSSCKLLANQSMPIKFSQNIASQQSTKQTHVTFTLVKIYYASNNVFPNWLLNYNLFKMKRALVIRIEKEKVKFIQNRTV
ncbi:hypothetical protein T4B_1028 [Trichinella pseudospiralis]|uniref:Uncharacterized protein n=1 Tax=Trichinella pseudospiralis TaxID=6337 RepID=A0A0V1IDV5_TRIPS|nr:hypothetical protein T4B_1028 [Trichinella pseudospiralis]